MIWVAWGVDATAWDVSVLCGAGGGSTVQADNTIDTTDSIVLKGFALSAGSQSQFSFA